MSFKVNTNWWIITKKQLEDLNLKDAVWREEAEPLEDRNYANYTLGKWYAQYALLFQQLDACLDQMVHPQKRVTVKKLVDSVAMRLLEFNDTFRELDLSEFHYIDGNLVELKLVPFDVEILHPKLFCKRPLDIEELWKRIQKGERIYKTPEEEEQEELMRKQSESEKAKKKRPKAVESGKQLLPEEMAKIAKLTPSIKVIQTAERARQERIYYNIKHTILKNKNKAKAIAIAKALGKFKDVETQTEEEKMLMENAAATIIQTYWRGYRVRIEKKYDEKQRRLLIGMYEPSWRSKSEFETLEAALEKRREYRDKRIKEYIESMEKEKTRILKILAPRIMEDISDEIREWFQAWYTNCDKFDDIPSAALGGTLVVMRGDTLTPQEYLNKIAEEAAMGKKAVKAMRKEEKANATLAKLEMKEKIKKEKEALKKELKKRKAEIAGREPVKFKYYYDLPVGLELYKEGIEEHKLLWNERDEFKNPQEKHYMEIITDQYCYEAQVECRRIVDDMMRIELNLLQAALARDKQKPYKKPPEANPKKNKGKKKKNKDPTADKKIEQLFQELVDNGIIRTYPKVSLDEFHGDFTYHTWEMRHMDLDRPHTLLDVRQAVVMNCIIPLGVGTMKRPKSVLITGPTQSGKHILANAIFNATQCVVFDLSPEIVAGNYEDARDVKMLINLVNKMTKLLAPSIIFFNNAEKLFYKRVPKEERQFNPKRIGKCLKSLIKSIKREDRVMILGISGQPFAAKNDIKKLFERHIVIPMPDYNSIYHYWSELLMANHAIDRNFNITALATVTVNYPFSVLKNTLNDILTVQRTLELKNKPLTAVEIYTYMLSNDIQPIDESECSKFKKWFNGLPISKKRMKYLKAAKAKREGIIME